MKFRKKPVVIEAIQYSGQNWEEISEWIKKEWGNGLFPTEPIIHTLEGQLKASRGDWIIKGVNGEFYPCKPDIFEKTYEKVEEIVK